MRKRPFTPYLLLLPSLLYLLLFFAYPTVASLQLAFSRDIPLLNLRAEPKPDAPSQGVLGMQVEVAVKDRTRVEETLPNGLKRPVYWFVVEAIDSTGKTVK